MISRAIPIALAITLFVYGAVAVSVLAGAGAGEVATSSAPLATAIEAGRLRSLAPVVRVGAAVASLGVLLSLIVGISRTLFAMASNGDMPRFLSAVHPRYRVPHRAELFVGLVAAVIAAGSDIRSAIGFSSFAVLLYYAIANASAWTLEPNARSWGRSIALVGLVGCVLLAATLPVRSIIGGVAMLSVGAIFHRFSNRPRTA